MAPANLELHREGSAGERTPHPAPHTHAPTLGSNLGHQTTAALPWSTRSTRGITSRPQACNETGATLGPRDQQSSLSRNLGKLGMGTWYTASFQKALVPFPSPLKETQTSRCTPVPPRRGACRTTGGTLQVNTDSKLTPALSAAGYLCCSVSGRTRSATQRQKAQKARC